MLGNIGIETISSYKRFCVQWSTIVLFFDTYKKVEKNVFSPGKEVVRVNNAEQECSHDDAWCNLSVIQTRFSAVLSKIFCHISFG